MKRLLITTALLITSCFLTRTSCATMPSGLVYEVRTTGASTNGGCYNLASDPGTDYSQQDSAQLSLSDLATTGAVTTLTSATGGFTSAMVGNCIYISSGTNFTVGYYYISAYTDTNTVTLDRTPTSAGAGSSGVGDVGGAVDHPDRVDSSLVSGNKVFVEDGDYQRLGSNTYVWDVSDSEGADVSTAIVWEGYGSTRGDTPTGDSRPNIDCADTATTGITSDGGPNIIIKNFIIQDCLGDGIYPDALTMYNVRSTSNVDAGAEGENLACFGCEFDLNGGAGVIINVSNRDMKLYNTYIHDNSSHGAGVNYAGGSGGTEFFRCVADTNSGNGFMNRSNGGLMALENIAYNNTTEGFWQQQAGEIDQWAWIGNIAVSNGAHGYSLDSTTREAPMIVGFNSAYNNTSGPYENVNDEIKLGNVTSNPLLNNPGSGDFTLQSGSPLLDAYYDFSEVNMTGAYKINIGLDQDDNAAGGGSGVSMFTFTR